MLERLKENAASTGYHDPKAVANEFIRLDQGAIEQLKLQKLIYFAQGWNLAIHNEPLVDAQIEAWDGGPIIRSIWDHMAKFGFNGERGFLSDPRRKTPFTAQLSQDERDLIEKVWKKYSKFTVIQLTKMIQQPGTPWSNAYFGFTRYTIISNGDMKRYFRELALAGRKTSQ